MKIIKTKIKGLVIIKTNIFKDRRGSFKEVFRKKILNKNFIFDCLSHSKKSETNLYYIYELLLSLPFFDRHFFYNVLCPYYYLSHKMTLRDAWQGPISIIYLIVDRMGGAARGCC